MNRIILETQKSQDFMFCVYFIYIIFLSQQKNVINWVLMVTYTYVYAIILGNRG